MGFVIGVIGALLVIFLLSYITIKKPKFGRTLIVLCLVLIGLSTYFYFQKDKRVEKRQSLIPLSEIQLSDIRHEYAYGSYYKLTGKVHNDSQRYRLQSMNLRISFYQCPESANAGKKTSPKQTDKNYNDCQLANQKEILVKTRLASGSTGGFEKYILLDQEHARKFIWHIDLISGVAR